MHAHIAVPQAPLLPLWKRIVNFPLVTMLIALAFSVAVLALASLAGGWMVRRAAKEGEVMPPWWVRRRASAAAAAAAAA